MCSVTRVQSNVVVVPYLPSYVLSTSLPPRVLFKFFHLLLFLGYTSSHSSVGPSCRKNIGLCAVPYYSSLPVTPLLLPDLSSSISFSRRSIFFSLFYFKFKNLSAGESSLSIDFAIYIAVEDTFHVMNLVRDSVIAFIFAYNQVWFSSLVSNESVDCNCLKNSNNSSYCTRRPLCKDHLNNLKVV